MIRIKPFFSSSSSNSIESDIEPNYLPPGTDEFYFENSNKKIQLSDSSDSDFLFSGFASSSSSSENDTEKSTQLKDYMDRESRQVDEYIINHKYDKLLEYTNFNLCRLMDHECDFGDNIDLVGHIIESDDKKIIKHVINNTPCISTINSLGWSLIHYLIYYMKDFKLTIYFIEKYHLDIEAEKNDNWRPIHLACRYRCFDLVKYLVDKNVNLNYQVKKGWYPVHLVCLGGDFCTIQYIISKNINLDLVEIKDIKGFLNVNDKIDSNEKLELENMILSKLI